MAIKNIRILPSTNDTVTSIGLQKSNNINNGTVNISQFPQLTSFVFTNQNIDSVIGVDVADELRVLSLSGCSKIDLAFNDLKLYNKDNLEILNLSNTKTTGSLDVLSGFNTLKEIYLNNIKSLSGNFILAPDVTVQECTNAQLTGTVQPFSNPDVKTIKGNKNNLTGALPSLASVPKIETIDFSDNRLQSVNFTTVPNTVKNINLSNNYFGGEFGLFQTYKILVAFKNIK
jgi:hypothetical protein